MKSKLFYSVVSMSNYPICCRIKQAISKKDEQVQALRIQFEAAVKRADHLEGLLAQQRKLIGTTPANSNNTPKKTAPS